MGEAGWSMRPDPAVSGGAIELVRGIEGGEGAAQIDRELVARPVGIGRQFGSVEVNPRTGDRWEAEPRGIGIVAPRVFEGRPKVERADLYPEGIEGLWLGKGPPERRRRRNSRGLDVGPDGGAPGRNWRKRPESGPTAGCRSRGEVAGPPQPWLGAVRDRIWCPLRFVPSHLSRRLPVLSSALASYRAFPQPCSPARAMGSQTRSAAGLADALSAPRRLRNQTPLRRHRRPADCRRSPTAQNWQARDQPSLAADGSEAGFADPVEPRVSNPVSVSGVSRVLPCWHHAGPAAIASAAASAPAARQPASREQQPRGTFKSLVATNNTHEAQ